MKDLVIARSLLEDVLTCHCRIFRFTFIWLFIFVSATFVPFDWLKALHIKLILIYCQLVGSEIVDIDGLKTEFGKLVSCLRRTMRVNLSSLAVSQKHVELPLLLF